MCLIFQSNNAPDTDPDVIVGYKVYVKRGGFEGAGGAYLRSPYNSHQHHGHIPAEGTYSIDKLPHSAHVTEHIPRYSPSYSQRVIRQGGFQPLPLGPDNVNKEVDIAGFHVIATKEAAEKFKISYVQFARHFEQDDLSSATVIVKVTFNKKDVFAYGTTPIDGWKGNGYTAELPTYVTKQITISTEDYLMAVK